MLLEVGINSASRAIYNVSFQLASIQRSFSEFRFLAKDSTTGNAMKSPYVAISQNYMKQVNKIWFQIYQVVKDNCSADIGDSNPQDNLI